MPPIQPINIGASPDDGTGDPIRTAFDKINANFRWLADFIYPFAYESTLTGGDLARSPVSTIGAKAATLAYRKDTGAPDSYPGGAIGYWELRDNVTNWGSIGAQAFVAGDDRIYMQGVTGRWMFTVGPLCDVAGGGVIADGSSSFTGRLNDIIKAAKHSAGKVIMGGALTLAAGATITVDDAYCDFSSGRVTGAANFDAPGQVCTIAMGAPGIVSLTGHNQTNDTTCTFTTTGALPDPLQVGEYYRVASRTADGFQLVHYTGTAGSPPITITTAGSGVHTVLFGKIMHKIYGGAGSTDSFEFRGAGHGQPSGSWGYFDPDSAAVTFTPGSPVTDPATVNVPVASTGAVTFVDNDATVTVTPTAAVAISNGANAAPGVVTHVGHGRSNGDPVILTTTGALPANLTASRLYYIVGATTDDYRVSLTVGGTAINTNSAGSGTHTANYPILQQTGHGKVVGEVVQFTNAGGGLPSGLSALVNYFVTVASANAYRVSTTPGGTDPLIIGVGTGTHSAHGPAVVHTNHKKEIGQPVRFTTTGALASPLVVGTSYFIVGVTTSGLLISATIGGAPIALTSAGSGTHTAHYGRKAGTPFRVAAQTGGSNAYLNMPGYSGTGLVPAGVFMNKYYRIPAAGLTVDSHRIEDFFGNTIAVSNAGTGTFLAAYGGIIKYVGVPKNVIGYSIIDDSAAGTYWIEAGYMGLAVEISGNTEKGVFNIKAVGAEEVVRQVRGSADSPSNSGTPDTNLVKIGGTRGDRLLTTSSRSSGNLPDSTDAFEIRWERRTDLGKIYTMFDGTQVPSPAILIDNGKATYFKNTELRAGNQRLMMLITRTGSNAFQGTDCVHFDTTRVTDNIYGTFVWADAVQHMTGRISARHVHNGRYNDMDGEGGPGPQAGIGSIPAPFLQLNQIGTGDFGATIMHSGNREGICIGDEVRNMYPRGMNFGLMNVVMRNPDNVITGAPGTQFNPLNQIPVNGVAMVIRKMTDGSVPFGTIEGHITLLDGCQGPRISLPSKWVERYNLTIGSNTRVTMVLNGPTTTDAILYLPWLREGIDLYAESVSDFGGSPMRYVNGKWITPGYPLTASAGALGSRTSAINQRFKRLGLTAINNSDVIQYAASGPAENDAWRKTADGSGAITPGYQAATTAHMTRMTNSAGLSPVQRDMIDRVFFELGDFGLTSKMVMVHFIGLHDEQASALNLMSTSFTLTKNGSPIFTAGRGYTGTGNTADYLATNFSQIAAANGTGQNNIHMSLLALTNEVGSGQAAGSFLSTDRARMRLINGTSSACISGNTTAAWTFSSTLPRYCIVNRVTSTHQDVYENGALVVHGAQNSNGLSGPIDLLRAADVACAQELFAFTLGQGLTELESLNLSGIMKRARQSVGL